MTEEVIPYEKAKIDIVSIEKDYIKKNFNQKILDSFNKAYELFGENPSCELSESSEELISILEKDLLYNGKTYKKPNEIFTDRLNTECHSIGYLYLKHFPRKYDKKEIQSFINWAQYATKLDAYKIRNKDIDEIICNYCKSKDFDINDFRDLLKIIESNSSVESITSIRILLKKAEEEYSKTGLFGWPSRKNKNKDLKDCYEDGLKAIQRIMDEARKQGILSLFFTDIPSRIGEILEIITQKEGFADIIKNDFLLSIFAYYIEAVRQLKAKSVLIDDIISRNNIDTVFNIVATYVHNENLQLDIIKTYMARPGVDENSWCLLPLGLIEEMLSVKHDVDDTVKKIILKELCERFAHTSENEQITIRELFKKVIYSANDIEVRQFAYESSSQIFMANDKKEVFLKLLDNKNNENTSIMLQSLCDVFSNYCELPSEIFNKVNEIVNPETHLITDPEVIRKLKEHFYDSKQNEKEKILKDVFPNIINNSEIDAGIRYDFFSDILLNLEKKEDSELLCCRINLCNEDFDRLKTKDFQFLKLVVVKFLEGNKLPLNNAFVLSLSFLKESQYDDVDTQKKCIDFIFDHKDSNEGKQIYKRLKNDIIGIFSSDSISKDLRDYIFRKCL